MIYASIRVPHRMFVIFGEHSDMGKGGGRGNGRKRGKIFIAGLTTLFGGSGTHEYFFAGFASFSLFFPLAEKKERYPIFPFPDFA